MEIRSQNNRVTVALETLGCKLNQAETELLARQLTEAGYIIVPADGKADIYILNTCTVTHVADRKSRHLLRMAHRRNPDARIIALGCYANWDGKALADIEGVDLIAGNENKTNLKQLMLDSGYSKPSRMASERGRSNRVRSFIKAQDGCNNYCTYCIVPLVRGREKSLPPEQVITEIQKRVADGYKEVVLTGTEVGRYHFDDLDLKGLLKRILADTEICRLRISSLQPPEINTSFLDLWQNPRLCRHFHISLQSGSDSVLQRMGRGYSAVDFARVVDMLNHEIPDVAITTDVIVGFPGETEGEFIESYEFCREMRFARMHIFSYSPRQGTKAAQMPVQIEPQLKKRRSEKMLSLAGNSLQNFHRLFLGKTQMVLFEQATGNLWSGITDTYIKVYVKSTMDLTNQILPVKLVDIRGERVLGELAG